jgi:hypothetical protein
MATGNMMVTLMAQTKGWNKSLRSASDRLGSFARGVALSVAGIAISMEGLVWQGAQMASKLEQSVGGVDQVFKDFADGVGKNAQTAADRMGLSMEQYNRTAVLTGTLLKNAGTPMDQLTGKTDTLLQRASDLAATFGGTVEDAARAMNAALRGEFEPIRAFGISLSQAEINQRALTDSGKDSEKQLSKNDKMMAAYALIMDQSKDAAGQFSREQDTMAGRLAIVQAKAENLGAKLGEKFLPVIGKVVDAVTEWMDSEEGKKFFEGVEDAVQAVIDWWEGEGGQKFRDAFQYVWDKIVPAAEKVWENIQDIIENFNEWLESPTGQSAVALLKFAFEAILNTVTAISDGLKLISDWFLSPTYGKLKDMESDNGPLGSKAYNSSDNPMTPGVETTNPTYSANSFNNAKSRPIVVNFNTPVDSVSAGKSVARVLKDYNRMNGRG